MSCSNKISIWWWFYDQWEPSVLRKNCLFYFTSLKMLSRLLVAALCIYCIQPLCRLEGTRGPAVTERSLVAKTVPHLPLDVWRTTYWTLRGFAKNSASTLLQRLEPTPTFLRDFFPGYSPLQEARCRSRIASFWSPDRLWRTSHTQQTSGLAGTNLSRHPRQCPLGSAGPPGATCGHHTPERAGPGPVSGWTWARQSSA